MTPAFASTYAETAGGGLHVLQGGAGAPLVLLGPAGRSAPVFAPLAGRLAARFRVLVPDLPGHGLSHPMPAETSIEALAGELLEALAGLGVPRAHFLGLHTGNKLCAAIAARRPGRVDRLALCGQSHSIVPDQQRRNAIIAGLPHLPGETECDTRALYAANFAYDLAADLARIHAPTLVLELTTDEEDRSVGRQAQAVQALIPGPVRLAELPHRHPGFCTLEHLAEETAALVEDFLTPAASGPPPSPQSSR